LRSICYNVGMHDKPSPWRRFQFRLRTLLIVVTLAAVSQPLLIAAWNTARPRTECSSILKPISLQLNGQLALRSSTQP
jgi:hypothetical protein